MARIRWNQNAARYIDNGKFVSRSKVFKIVADETNRAKARLRGLARLVSQRKITISDYQERSLSAIKKAYLQLGMFGAGGRDKMDIELRNFMTFNLGETAERFYKLGRDLKDKKISEAMLLARADQYGEQARVIFYWADKEAHRKAGKTEARRGLTPGFKHCDECISYERLQWTSIDNVNPRGYRCSCGGHCKCWIQYRKPPKPKKVPQRPLSLSQRLI